MIKMEGVSWFAVAIMVAAIGIVLWSFGYRFRLIRNCFGMFGGNNCNLMGLAFFVGFCTASFHAFGGQNANISTNDGDSCSGGGSHICMQEKLVFVTTTRFRLEQVATLTKVGQALYFAREDLIWVVVSITEDQDLTRKSHESESQLRMEMDWGGLTRRQVHLAHLNRTLARFGVHFVLMERINSEVNKLEDDVDDGLREAEGLVTGVIWALQNVESGVLMLGSEQFSYHHRIFKEVKTTKVASIWPVGLGRWAGFSTPILDKDDKTLIGHFDGNFDKWSRNIYVHVGGAGIRIEYLQKNHDVRENMLKIMLKQEILTFTNLSIANHDIQLLGKAGNEILVWRTYNLQEPWPKKLRYMPSYRNSSIVKLWQNFFNVFYDQIPVDTEYRDEIFRILF